MCQGQQSASAGFSKEGSAARQVIFFAFSVDVDARGFVVLVTLLRDGAADGLDDGALLDGAGGGAGEERGIEEVVAGRDEDDVVLGGLVEGLDEGDGAPAGAQHHHLLAAGAGGGGNLGDGGGGRRVGDGRAGGGGDATHGLDASALVEARAGEGDARGKRGGARGGHYRSFGG